uniref:Apolipoprotein B-100-like n=1 Tax=Sparus aurata TaxID=8175 RepID=A0A671WBY7_SPAAU
MGDSKLCLSLLLTTLTLTLNQRYKANHKYEYLYEAESLNAINGASHLRNGPKATCKVEIEVPQACSFIVRTTGCTLSEVVDMDAEGNPVFGPSPSSDAFAAEMERYPLMVTVEGVYDVKLYPKDGETTTILNIKRGIISALAVPLLEEDKNRNMPTIHGKCKTHYSINAREDIATDISLTRDLSRCEKFNPMRDPTSPLALISGMHYALAQLVRSSQECNYKFDNENKHMTSGSCTEKHILIPFSHNGENGVNNVGKQELTLVQVSPHNEGVFYHSDTVMGLHMEAVEDKSVVQDKDAGLNLLRELANLPETEGERRAHLFHKLVTMVRGMKVETLSPAIPEALAVSPVLTYQVLAQCGTPECSSAIMQILRTFDSSALEVDAGVFAMGLVSNPSALLINDMLEMAKYKPSKAIMFALSNVVKRFYKAEGKLIPEIYSVAEFMGSQLGDCSGDKDNTFMTLRVIGNMAPALGAASPALRTAVIQCVNQPAASPAVQQAAIQVYRLTPVPEEGREVLMQVLLDSASPMQKRIAAYLVLMKDPQPTELSQLADALPSEQDTQVKSFVISYITNILSSSEPETQELRQKIRDALQGNEVGSIMDPTKFSRNYRIGSVEGNMIFEGTSYLPKEVMLEMTLKAFGYDIDMMEIGMEGKGFEPTVEALFGNDGFFPDTALKTMYFVSDNIMHIFLQASQNLMRDIGRNLNKLVRELKTAESPEAMVYLRLLGNELGYLRTNEMEEMAYSAAMMIDSMFRMFPTDVRKLSADNTIFAHYIFMDNEFFLPTITGVPLRIALSGTFTPGIKGGLKIAPDMSEVTFMPSAGIEFVTQVGSHMPEYVSSGLEMHTNIFHESGLSARISFECDNVKLTIPAPLSPTKLIKMTECTPVFAGMKYCTALQYIDAFSQETAPYFPFTGDSKFAVELHPTGEVTEYTATVAYELLGEGEEGRQKVDSLKFILRAEGTEPTEARAIMKYNRRKNVITADIQIPDYDVEAGLRLGVVDGKTKGKGTHSISIDIINKNIPQLSLVGRANLKAMKEGMLQVQLLVPSINADATVTANIKCDEELDLELKSEIKVMETTSEQKVAIKYGTKVEVELKSDVNSEILEILPYTDKLKKYGKDVLDMRVGESDMTVSEIFKSFLEVQIFGFTIILTDRYLIFIYILLEKAIYHFNNERLTIAIPLPLGGKSTEELNFPPALTTPSVSLPNFGLEIVPMEIPIPELVVPESLSLSIPLFGKAEVSTLMRSNLYDMEASMAAGKDVVETPSYSAKFDVKGTSPIDILSISTKIKKKSSISIEEEVTMTDKVNLKSSSKIEATSPFGLNIALEHTGMTGINTEEISADSNFEGMFKAGPMYGKTISTQSFAIFPFMPEAKIDSSVQIDSTIVQAQNTIAASLANGEFSVVSNTNAFEDIFTNVAELSFKDSKLSLKSDANALALGMKIRNQAEASAGAGEVVMRMDTNADCSDNRVYSLLTASLDVNGLTVNNDATMKLLENEATHKATLRMNKDGVTTTGTTTLQSPLALENTFNAELDASRATLSITNKAALNDIKVDNANTVTITLSSLDFNSKAEATTSEHASYTHDITIDLKLYTASANVNNNLKLLEANFINEAQLKAELYKIDLTGSLKAIYGEEEIKHTYQVNYADMTANAKCSTTGKVFGTHMSHNTELEVVGLAARFTNDARFNSQPMRFDHTIRSSIVPFDFNLDAVFNADGDMTMYGKHSSQLYGKFLLRAQPLAFASSHECRASVTQKLDNGFSLETILDTNMDNVLSLTEQKTSFRMKSKLNEHGVNQEMSVYNTPERMGMELSGTILTNILNSDSTQNQEFAISGFLKYDKSTNSHIIQLPLIESLPVFLESFKGLVVRIAEKLQDYINNEEMRAKLEALSQHLSDFVSQLNVEDKLIQLKQFFSYLIQEYVITMEDVEASLTNLKVSVEKLLADLSVFSQNVAGIIKEIIVSNNLPETLIQKIQEQINAINEEFDIKAIVVSVIDSMREMIQQIDLEKLEGSSIAFLRDVDARYEIMAALQRIMSVVKEVLTMNYLPPLPEFSLPEITLVEFSFPTLPHVPAEKLVKTLQLPAFELPVIPSEFMIPGFGKLSYEIKANTPIYTISNAAEIQSSLDVDETQQLTAFLTSQGTSLSYEILNFNLDSTARIAVPNGQRLIAAETLTFTHKFLALDHHASLTFNDFSVQASAKTTVKATTESYNAEILNEAFLATKGGLSATFDTSYKHVLNLPVIGLTDETSCTQKVVAHQEGTTITVTVGNQGTSTFNSHDSIHKSELQVTVNPSTAKLTVVSDTDTVLLKMRQTLSADLVIFSYFKFDIRSEAEGPTIKNNLLVGSVNANLHDMTVELKATHSTDLTGIVNGALNNVIDLSVCPRGVLFNFQNKGNTKVIFNEALTAKIDLQNDYSVTFSPDTQHVKTVALARINQHKLFWNFTIENSEREAAILAAVEGEANLDFLTRPISIPEIDLPFVEFNTPAISDLDLYDQTGLKHILTTSEQSVDVDAKVIYKKSQAAPLVDLMGLIQVPSVGDLITELSFKSAIINLNANAGLYTDDDLVFRLGATTASVFDSLKAKLDSTTSLTTKRGIKLANSLSLENPHIEGTHDSTLSVSTETFETAVSVATVAKIALPVLNLDVNQNLVADTKTKPNVLSTLGMKGDFNIPVIKAVGKAEAEHSLKLEGTFDDSRITMNSDITSAAFTDMNLRYAVRKDGISATISIPSTGFLGLQLHGRIPSQMNARLYGRYASDPGQDVDILTIRGSAKDADKMNLKMVFNMEAPEILLSGLQERLPVISSCLSSFAEKYQLFTYAAQLKDVIIDYTEEAHNIAKNHAQDLSQLSILFRNTVVQYQKAVQVLLDAAVKVLRETSVKLSGSEEMTPLLEVLNKMTIRITVMVEKVTWLVAVNVEYASNAVIDMISKIQVTMPIRDVMAGAKIMDVIRDTVKTMPNPIVDVLKQMENLDMFLEKLGDILKSYVDKAQDFVDNAQKSDVLDAIAVYINALYEKYVSLVKTLTAYAYTAMDIRFINNSISYILDVFRSVANQFNHTVTDYLQQAPAQYRTYIKVKGRKLEITL